MTEFPTQLFIDGRLQPAKDDKMLPQINPANEENSLFWCRQRKLRKRFWFLQNCVMEQPLHRFFGPRKQLQRD